MRERWSIQPREGAGNRAVPGLVPQRTSARGGVKLVSPNGKATRDVSATSASAYAFSADGQSLYGIRRAAADRLELFRVSVAERAEKTIGSLGQEYLPVRGRNPGVRLSLAPDGKSVTYSTVKSTSNLWLAEGLDAVTPR
jgi:hypothetical protein